ncbi:hypothetical protein ILUMI_24235 [Ignelater luminosus]|uniref:Uncharacterized protein n=1 Tax=Ignelater luminosus TaxID=2038154 RepID=A0A8K0G133_IGNLU|nr:hypothetical protein ILUMI_24235 [Ignelater luminosus]
MPLNRLILTIGLIFLSVPYVFCGCRIVQTFRGVDKYNCDSIQDLKQYGTSDMLDLSITGDKKVHVLNYNVFQNTPNLETLDIRRSISGINNEAFRFLHQINTLEISFNDDFTVITADCFGEIPVSWLSLSYNHITEIAPGAFANLKKLKRLDLKSNSLGKITKGVFSNTPVETLSLSKNGIRLIEENAFNGMENLKNLQLDGNRLTEFQAESLINPGHKLQILWLHNNSFEEISRNTLKGLDNLKLLNLLDNRISKILPYTFDSVPNLETLILSNNSLESIDAEVFPEGGMPKLKSLLIDHNHLSFLTTRVMGKLLNLKGIRLGGNPWICICFDTILLWLNDHSVKLSCDEDYFQGSRPICVTTEASTCTYTIDRRSLKSYLEANSKLPPPKKYCFP